MLIFRWLQTITTLLMAYLKAWLADSLTHFVLAPAPRIMIQDTMSLILPTLLRKATPLFLGAVLDANVHYRSILQG